MQPRMNRLFNRVLQVQYPVIFKRLRGCMGYCEVGVGGHIEIDLFQYRRISPASIYLHECLHILRPKFSEKMILALERYMWRRLSPKQRFLLYRKLFNRRWRAK